MDTESAVAGLQGPVAGDAKLQLGHTWNKQITAREKREKVDDKYRDSHQERKERQLRAADEADRTGEETA